MPRHNSWPEDAADFASKMACTTASAGQISLLMIERFGPRYTRNAVIGFMNRHRATIWQATRPDVGDRKGHGLRKPKVERRAKPMAVTPAVKEPTTYNVDAVFALRIDQCRFVVGDMRAGGTFCEADAREGSSYCEEHHAICFTKRNPKAARERAIDARLRHLKQVRAEAEQSA